MTNNKLPTARYAKLSNLDSLLQEKTKLRMRLRKQEGTLKTEVDDFVDIFRFFGNFASLAKQFSSAIPLLNNIKLIFKLIGLFRN